MSYIPFIDIRAEFLTLFQEIEPSLTEVSRDLAGSEAIRRVAQSFDLVKQPETSGKFNPTYRAGGA